MQTTCFCSRTTASHLTLPEIPSATCTVKSQPYQVCDVASKLSPDLNLVDYAVWEPYSSEYIAIV